MTYKVTEQPNTNPRAVTITNTTTGEAETVTVNTTATQHEWALKTAREHFEANPTIINYTPHDINIYNEDSKYMRTYPSQGMIRLRRKEKLVTTMNNIPVWSITHEATPETLPPPLPYTYFVVSSVVAEAHPHRKDFLTPHKLVKDSHGKIIGTKGLRTR